MTCVIEIDGIRVEADSETSARKEMRKAQRAAQKERDAQAKRQEHAENVAKCRAFGVMARILNGETLVIWLQESVGEDASPYAIAACDGAVGIVPLPKAVGKELFRDKREE